MKNKTSIKHKAANGIKSIVMRSCPFCGCKPKLTKGNDLSAALMVSSFRVDISCRSKKCKVHPSLTGYNRFAYSEDEKKEVTRIIIAQWNKRHDA